MANETTENELNQTGEPGTEYFMETLPGQDRYVAPLEETQLQDVDSVDESAPATSMWADAWRTLRRNPLFIISGLLIIFIIVVAIAPGLFTKQDPNACDLGNSLSPSTAGHPFGFDLQGCDVYTRVVYGTRTSLSVGVLSTLLMMALGAVICALLMAVLYTLQHYGIFEGSRLFETNSSLSQGFYVAFDQYLKPVFEKISQKING